MGKARRDIPIKGFTYRKTGRNNIAPPTKNNLIHTIASKLIH